MKPHIGCDTEGALCNSVHSLADTLSDAIDITNDADVAIELSMSWCIGEVPPVVTNRELEDPIRPYETKLGVDIGELSETVFGRKGEVAFPHVECEEKECKAMFHTHTNNDERFSHADYASAFNRGVRVNCLGTRNKDGENNVACDVIDIDHEKYPDYRDRINDINLSRCVPAMKGFVKAVEGEGSLAEANAYHTKFLSGYLLILNEIDDAIEDGVLSRCSKASNLLPPSVFEA